MTQIARILLPLAKLFPFDYLIPGGMKLAIGDLVIVPFINKELTAIVWDLGISPSENIKKIKFIKQKAPLEFTINQQMIELIKWTASYYMSELGSIAKLALPVDIAEQPIKVKHQQLVTDFILPPLSEEQQQAFTLLKQSEKPSVIRGVTGSGKTEIYFHLLADYLQQGKQILIMLPEIALSQQIISRFITRFGFEPVIWNSSVTKAQKKMILRGVLSNEVKVIIGARSSLFLPYSNLGLIILDEEHDSSYKQDENILYNARDVAVLRGKLAKLKIVLCSATPSIETMYNAILGKYQLIKLSNRYQQASLPKIQIIDMRKQKLAKNCYLSSDLISAISQKLASKEQILLFLNRRGYAPLMLCKHCGYRFACNFCSAWLVVHKFNNKLECHHCGYQTKIHTICPDCSQEDSLTFCGPGIERIEEEVRDIFPNNKIAVMSADYSRVPKKARELLSKMEHFEIDILIGTQIITKGYHFPNLTLVGVVNADLGAISSGDLWSGERNYQLLNQVGGRAGRKNKKGLVLMQTYYPDNVLFNHLQNGEDCFLQYELATRYSMNMPPFTKMAAIVLSGKNDYKVLNMAKNLVAMAPTSSARILGPSSAIMAKLAGKFRYRILVIVDRKFDLQKFLQIWLGLIKIPSSYQLKIDIDPKNFY